MSKRIYKANPATALALLAASLLSACASVTSGPDYQRPPLEVPATLAVSGTAQQLDWLTWWKGFQDPVLDALLQEAASNSQDLALATARMAEARATLNQNQANFYPTVDLNASTTRRRSSENSATFSPGSDPLSSDRQLGLSASYEIDFWGKYARADEAARARLMAQAASRGTVLTTLYANVAQSYFALRALDAQVTLAEQTLATRQETLRLQKRRFEGGVIGELDLHQAESEAASVEASLQATRQNRSNTESALATLLGRKPTDIMHPVLARGAEVSALYAHQAIPSNLPSDVLNRRPDVISAEQNLVAAHADIGQARAAYFPKLSLTAGLGKQSKDLSTLFDPASLFWNMVGNLTQPVFRAGAIDAVVAAANARQQQALAQYTQTVQNAFRDVHDALNNIAAGREITTTSTRRLEALRNTLRLSDLRYRNGYSSYLEVLNAQRDLAQAESGLIDIQRSQLNAVVSLYKALGGGWDASSVVAQAAR
ncbi:MAG: efflux transporter outer membrane subunit [Gammaproteobacteria bacterium]|nr:efflux transporter outer membrane subunit [Gammaproteobacteria bacterium]MBU0787219.1 efflux transporter outer membrane subunit [Gammaproteobacteria bacterium]MBU0814226.1 efflux transporter outer membrane subunit [Gammaproteobacteria bacterium]MBU1786254.1 efflux transporter outer membrane subunit [Gammaproteobacteria bacterium]